MLHETLFFYQINEASTLSWDTRIKGFAICFVVGILFTLLASFALFLNRGLTVFAAFYTIGNVLSILSTCFLMGPVKQFKKMFSSTRWIATCIMIASLVLTLVAALVVCSRKYLEISRYHNSFCMILPYFIILYYILDEKSTFGSFVHYYTSIGNDMVLTFIYSLCQRYCFFRTF